jgi:NAD(P)-dependent dehydrogenase (short-subunit alcohol dehydrogenase family)
MVRRRLDGKVAIVTGAGSRAGIGRSEVLLLAEQGAKIVVNDIGTEERFGSAAAVVEEVHAAGEIAVASTEDISTFAGARRLIETAINRFERLDILINNAGLRAAGPIQDITEEQYDTVLDSHLRATFATIKYAAPFFCQQQSGVILNTSSEAGIGQPFNAAYSAAKEGIAGLTRTVARELGPKGVRCNQIRPRSRSSQRAPEFEKVLEETRLEREALGRYGFGNRGDVSRPSTPDNVAALAVWLCTDAASPINGRDFFVAGPEVGLWSEPELVRSAVHAGGWTLDLLDEIAPGSLTQGLENLYDADRKLPINTGGGPL